MTTTTPPTLVWGATSLGESGELRYEIHIADDCPNAASDLWRDSRTAPAGTTLGELFTSIATEEMITGGSESETDIRVCRCALTGQPQPRTT